MRAKALYISILKDMGPAYMAFFSVEKVGESIRDNPPSKYAQEHQAAYGTIRVGWTIRKAPRNVLRALWVNLYISVCLTA